MIAALAIVVLAWSAIADADRVRAREQYPAPPGRVVLAVVDDLGATAAQRLALARELDRARTALIRDDDLLAIVSTGPSSVESGLIADRERRRTEQAVARIATAPDVPLPRDAVRQRDTWHTAIRVAHALVTRHGQLPGPRVLFLITDGTGAFSDERISRAAALAAGRSSLDPIPSRGTAVSEETLTADLATMLATAGRLGVEVYRLTPSGSVRRAVAD